MNTTSLSDSIDDSKKIELLDNREIAEAVEKGVKDEKLKEEIKKAWKKFRGRTKGQNALEHDSGLLMCGKYLRDNGQKCWVLTLDRTLHSYDLKRTKEMDLPLLLSLDVLIQVLGLNGAGPDFDPVTFAPLLASIIRYQFEPLPETYTIEDLGWLMDIEERCADLPKEKVMNLALKVKKARLSGARKDDAELRLTIQRSFQGEKLKITKSLEVTEEKLETTSEKLGRRKEIANRLRLELKGEKKIRYTQKARKNLTKSIAIRSGISLTIIIAGWFIVTSITDILNQTTFWGIYIGIIIFAVGVAIPIFTDDIPRYKNEVSKIDRIIEEDLKNIDNR